MLKRVLQNSGCPGNRLRHDWQQLACSSLVFTIGPAEFRVMTRVTEETLWERPQDRVIPFAYEMPNEIEGLFWGFFFPFWGSGWTCCERRPNTPLMSLNVMPWPRPSARIIICTKPVWRRDLCCGEAPGTLAQLCGGSGTPSLSDFGVIRQFFPPQPFYLWWSGGEMFCGLPRPSQALASVLALHGPAWRSCHIWGSGRGCWTRLCGLFSARRILAWLN